MSNPVDRIEGIEAMRSVAELARRFYVALIDEGFDSAEALTLTVTWLSASVSRESV